LNQFLVTRHDASLSFTLFLGLELPAGLCILVLDVFPGAHLEHRERRADDVLPELEDTGLFLARAILVRNRQVVIALLREQGDRAHENRHANAAARLLPVLERRDALVWDLDRRLVGPLERQRIVFRGRETAFGLLFEVRNGAADVHGHVLRYGGESDTEQQTRGTRGRDESKRAKHRATPVEERKRDAGIVAPAPSTGS